MPLLIMIQEAHQVALNYTCRYCRTCDLLVAHKHEIEHLLHELFSQLEPGVVGNDYFILGTVEKATWRIGLSRPQTIHETLPHLHDFKWIYPDLRVTQAGWFPRDVQPPVMEPPPSREWLRK